MTQDFQIKKQQTALHLKCVWAYIQAVVSLVIVGLRNFNMTFGEDTGNTAARIWKSSGAVGQVNIFSTHFMNY